jgi:spore coat protein U-like protein
MRAHSAAILLAALPTFVLGADTISTSGYSVCLDDANVQVTTLEATYNRNTRVLNFNVAGSSSKEQNVTATIVVSAYGQEVYNKSFSPCDNDMPEMCPGTSYHGFAAYQY